MTVTEAGRSRAVGWFVVLVLLLLWEAVTRTGIVSSPDLPPPSAILRTLNDMLANGTIARDLATTLLRALIGFGVAVVVGVGIGTAMGVWPMIDSALEPAVELLRPVPVTALVPLMILLVGIGHELKILAAFTAAVFPVLVSTIAGTRSVSDTLKQTALTFNLTSGEWIRKIVLPAAAPSIFVGLRLGLTVALVVTVVTEMIAGNNGIGYAVLQSQQMMLMPELYAGVLVLAATGYGVNFLFTQAEQWLLFWSEHVRSGRGA
jgi:ABC-type nitrate/sulfonate/bicarbonate transport system permease component